MLYNDHSGDPKQQKNIENMTPAREPKQHLEASGGIWRHLGEKVVKSIVFYSVLARDPLFRCRVAQVGGTKYRKTHGSRRNARPELTRGCHSPTVTHAARNPTGQA